MTEEFVPVLALRDPEAGLRRIGSLPGFRPGAGPLSLCFGDQTIRLAAAGSHPAGLWRLPFDHLALRVPETGLDLPAWVDRHPAFTPDGPVTIPEFWQQGVRFVFADAAEGWPLEFCARLGSGDQPPGHDHVGLRVADHDRAVAEMEARGARILARHRLERGGPAVHVTFLSLGNICLEIFDEAHPPALRRVSDQGWIGLMPAGA